MLRTFGIDGHQQPTIAVLHLPAALSMRTAAGKTAAARTFAAASHAGPVGVIDYATTHDSRLVSADGRAAIAIYDMPTPDQPPPPPTMHHILPPPKSHPPPPPSPSLPA